MWILFWHHNIRFYAGSLSKNPYQASANSTENPRSCMAGLLRVCQDRRTGQPFHAKSIYDFMHISKDSFETHLICVTILSSHQESIKHRVAATSRILAANLGEASMKEPRWNGKLFRL
jgi:hypothetical protein